MRFHLSTRTDLPKLALKHMGSWMRIRFRESASSGFAESRLWISMDSPLYIRLDSLRIRSANPWIRTAMIKSIPGWQIQHRNNNFFIILKNDRIGNVLLIFIVTSAESKHLTYLYSIFVFAYVLLYMLFKIRTSLLQGEMFLTWRKLTVQSASMETCYNGLPN